MYFCKYKISTEVEYGNDWELSVEGFSLSAFSLFGDTSAYNEYTEDKIAEQNSGIEVYAKTSGQSRDDVNVIITSTFATETKFNLTAIDYSIFAFSKTTWIMRMILRVLGYLLETILLRWGRAQIMTR